MELMSLCHVNRTSRVDNLYWLSVLIPILRRTFVLALVRHRIPLEEHPSPSDYAETPNYCHVQISETKIGEITYENRTQSTNVFTLLFLFLLESRLLNMFTTVCIPGGGFKI